MSAGGRGGSNTQRSQEVQKDDRGRLDRPADLLAVYERQLELTEDYRERVKMLFQCAAIWEDRYQNPANADACIEGVLAHGPAEPPGDQDAGAAAPGAGPMGGAGRRARAAHPARHRRRGAGRARAWRWATSTTSSSSRWTGGRRYHARAGASIPSRARRCTRSGTLYERSGNWPFALDMLQREAQVAGQHAARRWSCYYRMGKINEDMLMDTGSAKACYQRGARASTRATCPASARSRASTSIEKDWDGYEQTLVQEAQQTEESAAKARRCSRSAATTPRRKEDAETATALVRGGAPAGAGLAGRRAPAGGHLHRPRGLGAGRADAGHRHPRQMARAGHREQDDALTARALPPAVPAGLRRGEARQARQGARRLREGLRARRHVPAGARGLRQPAGAGQALRRGAEGLPDHPHPPPRGPDRSGDGGDLLAARRRPHRSSSSTTARRTTSRRRWPSTRATSRRCARWWRWRTRPGSSGAVGRVPPEAASRCWTATPSSRSRWSSASSRARSSTTRTWRSTPTPAALRLQPERARGDGRALRALPRDAAGREGGRDAGADARRSRSCQAEPSKAKRVWFALGEILRDELQGDRTRAVDGVQRRAGCGLPLHRGVQRASRRCSGQPSSGSSSRRTTRG